MKKINELFIITDMRGNVDAITDDKSLLNLYIEQKYDGVEYNVSVTHNQVVIDHFIDTMNEDLFLYQYRGIALTKNELDFVANTIEEEVYRVKRLMDDLQIMMDRYNIPKSHISQLKDSRKLVKKYIKNDNILDIVNVKDAILDIQEDRRIKNTLELISDLNTEYRERIK